MYLPVIDNKFELTPVGHPFVLLRGAKTKIINADPRSYQKLVLNRKSNSDYDLIKALRSVQSSVIEGANTQNFTDKETLMKIKDTPEPRFNNYTIDTKKKFRYFRIIHPRGVCRVAELKMFGIKNSHRSAEFLTGKIIFSQNKKGSGPNNATDNNVLTYFTAKDSLNGYIGVDLGVNNSAQLTKVSYYPPNDGNSVEIGDRYELFYWDDAWKSLGKMGATSEQLVYPKCPKNALFKLRNLTKGYKERIFSYEKGNQIWW